MTNAFGDFEFEGLGKDKEYTVEIKHPSYKVKELYVSTKTDMYLGDIVLEKI